MSADPPTDQAPLSAAPTSDAAPTRDPATQPAEAGDQAPKATEATEAGDQATGAGDQAPEATVRWPRARRALQPAWRLAAQTTAKCMRYRVTGLAAEAAFFAVLSLPPLIFGLAGGIGFVARTFDVQTIANFRDTVVTLASRGLTPDTVNSVIEPTVDDVLSSGRVEVISIGFVLALWSGSRALNVFVDTITIMYGLAGRRGILRTRALSFSLYLVFLLAGAVLLPLVLAGPRFVDQVLPQRLEIVGRLYWPVVLVFSACILATLYHLSIPARTRWRADLPGAGLTLLMWIGGSALLRLVLGKTVGSTSIYGPLAAPIAVLIWLYVISIAVLIGAAFNSSLDVVFPRLSGIDHNAGPNAGPRPTRHVRRTPAAAGRRILRRLRPRLPSH